MNALSNQEFGSIQGSGKPGMLIVILKSIFIPQRFKKKKKKDKIRTLFSRQNQHLNKGAQKWPKQMLSC